MFYEGSDLKDLVTIVLGSDSLIKNLHGLGEVFFIKKRDELFEKVDGDRIILFLELSNGLNFDLSYFLKYASINSMGLFYEKAPKKPFFLLNKDFSLKEITFEDPYYFDGLIPAGAYLSTKENLKEIFKGNYSSLKGVPLGRNNNYQDPKNLKKVLFLDRDGIINIDKGYVFETEKLIIYEEVVGLIKAANQKNMPVVVLTNQSGVAKGWYKENDVKKLHDFLQEKIRLLGGKIDAFFYSPFHPTEGLGEYKKESLLRKPGPGMALLACDLFPIDFSRSYMVGDKLSDNLLIPGLQCINFQRGYDLSGTTFPICTSYKAIIDLIFNSK